MGWQYLVALGIVTQKRNDLSTNVTNFTDETVETNGFRGAYNGHRQQSVWLAWTKGLIPHMAPGRLLNCSELQHFVYITAILLRPILRGTQVIHVKD